MIMKRCRILFILCYLFVFLSAPVFGVSQFLELSAGTNGGTGFENPFFSLSIAHSVFFDNADILGGFHYT